MLSFLPPDVTEAILGDLHEEARLRRAGRAWVYWQASRSMWPLAVRAIEREGAINVGLWFLAGYLVFAIPVFGVGSIRDFVLTQVPLRAGAAAGPVWIAVLVVSNLSGMAFGCWLALKRMTP
jgi:hypothetical protein